MKFKKRFVQYAKETCCPQRHDDELPVVGNLVVTPAAMMKMQEKGLPISAQNMAMLPSDGEVNPSWTVPLDQVKGIDPAQLWEHSQIIKEKARMAHLNDVKRYGVGELKQRESKK